MPEPVHGGKRVTGELIPSFIQAPGIELIARYGG